MRKIVNNYFENLTFTKTKHQGNYAVYVARIESYIGKNDKIVALTVLQHLAIKPRIKIHEIYWKNIQTRNFPTFYPRLTPQKLLNKSLHNVPLITGYFDANSVTYFSPICGALKVILLNKIHENKITLEKAIKSWNCIISLE